MHIALLADFDRSGTPTGGVQTAVAALARALSAAGERVTIVAPASDLSAPVQSRYFDVPVVHAPMGGRFQIATGYAGWARNARAAVEEIGPDIVHAHGTLHNGAAALACTGPRVLTVHGDALRDARWHYPATVNVLVRPLLRRAVVRSLSGADHVIDVSPDWRTNCPVEPQVWSHIPNAIDAAFFSESAPAPRRRVLYVGGSRHIKGADMLLEVWPGVRRRVPDATLILVGYDAAVPSAAEGITVFPQSTTQQLAELLAGGGVAVVPSRFEVAPMAIAEAWAARIPVVATRVGGVPALAEHRAYLCEPEPDSLRDALVIALEQPESLSALVEAGARAAVASHPAAVARDHIALYEALLAR